MTVKITKNNWRPFIELTPIIENNGTITETGNKLYFDVTKRPVLVEDAAGYTVMILSDNVTIVVKESVKDILKAVDKMIKDEADKQAAEAEKYMQATAARVAETKSKLESEEK